MFLAYEVKLLRLIEEGNLNSCIVQAPLGGARQAPRHSIHNGGGAWSALSVPTAQLEGRRNNRSRELRKARHEWSADRRDRAARSCSQRRAKAQPSAIYVRPRFLSVLPNYLSETGFCRRIRSRSLSRASAVAVSFFTCAARGGLLIFAPEPEC